ncbi:MAG: hypothetical protein HY850_02045, partial [Betaproteobacteria bacterium]|nr:hypothetical protein [Betaproteobacteria bacterium]
MTVRLWPALAALLCSVSLHAQPLVERVRLGDNELSCKDLHAEAGQMDKLIAEAKAAESDGNATSTAGSVAGVAAKVAGGTGLFGQIGGLLGGVVGQAATEAAAGLAQQTGQQGAQQAAERRRQALARKEHVSSLFVGKGCKVSDLGYEPPPRAVEAVNPAAAATPSAASAAAAFAPLAAPGALPDTAPEQFFKGKMGGT